MYQDRLMSGLPGIWKGFKRFRCISDTDCTFSVNVSVFKPGIVELSWKGTE